MNPVNVVCIKWGDKYPSLLCESPLLRRAAFPDRPFRFVCFTEEPAGIDAGIEVLPLPAEPFEAALVALLNAPDGSGAWRKISLFRSGLAGMKGRFSASTSTSRSPVRSTISSTSHPARWHAARLAGAAARRPGGHGSVFRFDPARHGYLYETFAADPDGAAGGQISRSRNTHRSPRSRTATSPISRREWISSFKRNGMRCRRSNHLLRRACPRDTRVMCFHGKPKMEEALEGVRGGFLRSTLPAGWLRDYWLQEPT